jgi:hypothetical protein
MPAFYQACKQKTPHPVSVIEWKLFLLINGFNFRLCQFPDIIENLSNLRGGKNGKSHLYLSH